MKGDPQFPDRPATPDFDVLALAAQQLDEESEHDDIPTVTSRICDIEAVTYLVDNRIGMTFGPLFEVSPKIGAVVQSAWMDGFAIGARYQRNGGKQKPPVDINAPDVKAPSSTPFDTTNPLYTKALETLVRAVVLDVPMENVERLFGVCCGVATVLVPAVYQTKQLPPEEIADVVCSQVIYDMQEGVRAWDSSTT